jgi:hypothetical protein
MKKSIYYWYGYQLEATDNLSLIKNCGFDGVTLWWGDEYINISGPKE